MTHSLALFSREAPVTRSALLNLRQEKIPFSNGMVAEHWNI
jgi:hypothetical protein